MEDGHTWEEAEDILDNCAEDQLQDQRDREVEEFFNQGESK
jgi:hypothetical protein